MTALSFVSPSFVPVHLAQTIEVVYTPYRETFKHDGSRIGHARELAVYRKVDIHVFGKKRFGFHDRRIGLADELRAGELAEGMAQIRTMIAKKYGWALQSFDRVAAIVDKPEHQHTSTHERVMK